MQIIGLCRFSYPALGGFQVEHETIEDRIRYLYAEHRLEERFRLFETVALPCLRRQTDTGFDLILLVGDSLPDVHLNRLRDLTADIPQVRIIQKPPGRHREVMKKVINGVRKDPSKPCLQFRFDDDDAVSVDFIERLRITTNQCRDFLKHKRSVAIDFSKGYVARIGPDGIAAAEVVAPWITAALAMYVRGGAGMTIMNFAHHRINQFMPAISLPDTPMWVRTHNDFNDSRQTGKSSQPDLRPLTEEDEGTFAALFNIDAAQVRQVFARA